MFTLPLLMSLRGDMPQKCDFCDTEYNYETTWPKPEEAGAWACNHCYKEWGYYGQEEKQ